MAPPSLPPHIAREAFMLLEKFDEQRGRRSRARPQQHPQTRPQIHAHRPPKVRTIDSVQAARAFGGVMICEHYVKKPSVGRTYWN